jgi:SET domain-containing protein 6
MLPLSQGGEGNPGDVVEIRADIVVDAVPLALIEESYREDRIDWWLDEGGDE